MADRLNSIVSPSLGIRSFSKLFLQFPFFDLALKLCVRAWNRLIFVTTTAKFGHTNYFPNAKVVFNCENLAPWKFQEIRFYPGTYSSLLCPSTVAGATCSSELTGAVLLVVSDACDGRCQLEGWKAASRNSPLSSMSLRTCQTCPYSFKNPKSVTSSSSWPWEWGRQTAGQHHVHTYIYTICIVHTYMNGPTSYIPYML